MPIVNVYCSDKAYKPELLKKLGEELGNIVMRTISVDGAEIKKESSKIFFFENGPYDVCDKDLVIYFLANDREERIKVLETNTKKAAEEIKNLITSLRVAEDEPISGLVYPFLGKGEVGKF